MSTVVDGVVVVIIVKVAVAVAATASAMVVHLPFQVVVSAVARPWNDTSLPSDRDTLLGLRVAPTLPKPEDVAGEDIAIKDVAYLGSYNWLDSVEPTIVVPGSPPVWRDRRTPYAVPRDTGTRFVDENGHRIHRYPLLPLIRAIDVLAEERGTSNIDWTKVDFIVDRNCLRKLLHWINDKDGTASEFRIDTQLAGKGTVLMSRWEKRTSEEADPAVWTYSLSFEHESTTPIEGCEQRGGHHRIVKYDFNGLLLVVRFYVDACTASLPPARPPTSPANIDDISGLVSGLNVSPNNQASSASGDTDTALGTYLRVKRGGSQVPQDSLVELATRSKKYKDQYNWIHTFTQLLFSQIPNHYFAVHERGTFETIEKRNLGDPFFTRLQSQAQASFRQAGYQGYSGRLSLVYQHGQLQVLDRDREDSLLPEAIMKCFE
ncbi:hypothetical protein BKA93DRAFT_886705 [Sparassis latifolia]